MSQNISDRPSASPATLSYDGFFGPFYFEPYAVEVVKRICPELHGPVLELGAGTGRVTRHIRERIPSPVGLIASDIDKETLGVAKDKLKHLNIDWRLIDATQLPFNDLEFDLVICCFGYMFVPDKAKAFSEALRVLKTGGLLLITTWDKLENNPASAIARSIAELYLPGPVPASYNLPTSMSESSVVETMLRRAGFSRVSIETVRLSSGPSTAEEAAAGLMGGGIFDEIRRTKPGSMDEIQVKLVDELSRKFGPGPMTAPISALITQAWK